MRGKRFAATTAGLLMMVALAATACGDDDPAGPQPATPATGLQATVEEISETEADVTVSWTPGDDLESQRVVLSASGSSPLEADVDASADEHTFEDVARGTTYSAQVYSIGADGDETGSPAITVDVPAADDPVVQVYEDILSNTTWTSDKVYVLSGPIFVGRDVGADGSDPDGVSATLTIEPGTTILGDVDPPQGARGSFLVVSRGSRLVADANANRSDPDVRPDPEDVIVFTSSASRGERARGDWGGLVINGRAPINSGDEAAGEGESGFYGGDDPEDDSGILRGVRIEFAGDDVTATDQLNGIAYQGVGAGTTVDYVQVHYNVDDGTEPFGGAVSQTHMVMTGIGDDSFDGTDGYRGFMQFAIAQQRADDADQGFEYSGSGDDPSASPKSTAVVANVTLVGAGVDLGTGEIAAEGDESDIGVLLREGANFRVFNTIAVGFGDSGFCVEGAVAAQNADNRLGGSTTPDDVLRFESSILWNNVDPDDAAENFADACGSGYDNQGFFEESGFDNMVADPGLPDEAFSIGSMTNPPNFVPAAMPDGYTPFDASTLNDDEGLVMPADGRTLQATDYAGAVAPGTAPEDAWYHGWTVWATDGSDSRPGLAEIGS
ncbi:MAG: hypothetical protein ACODAE_01510 [Gemmatimonadota bacterium]